MRFPLLIFAMLIVRLAPGAACLNQTLITFEGGTNGTLVSANLALTNSILGSPGQWVVTNPSNQVRYTNFAQKALVGSIDLCSGGAVTGAGSLGVVFAGNTQDDQNLVFYPTNGGTPISVNTNLLHASIGCWVMTDMTSLSPTNNGRQHDSFFLKGDRPAFDAGGDFVEIAINNRSDLFSGLFFMVEGGLHATIESVAPTTPGTRYWETAQMNFGGSNYVRIYDTNLTLIGSIGWPHDGFSYPHSVGLKYQSGDVGTHIFYDSILVDFDTGVFPLLPTTPAPSNTTITATDANQPAVVTAIAAASDGDTVEVPSGTGNWTNIAVSKAITLRGAGIGSTIIKVWADQGTHLLTITGTANKTNCMTGFEFQKGTNFNNAAALIKLDFVDTDARRVRICSNKFNMVRQQLFLAYSPLGVFDHNICLMDTNGVAAAWGYVKGSAWQGVQSVNSYGDGAQYAADNFGTDKFFFIEDNFFSNCYSGNLTMIDCQAGGRYVVRSNFIHGLSFESHGLEAQRERSGRAFEIYGNNITGYGDRNSLGYFRGGTGVFYSNTVSGWSSAVVALLNNRTRDVLAVPFGGADGRNPYDSNSVSNPFVTGTVTSSGALTLTDSGKSWTVNQWGGYIVRKTSGKTVSSMTRSGSTVTVTCTAHGFTSGDIVSVYGADQQAYTSIYSITVTDANTFTFTTLFTPTSPATGTIRACAGNWYSEIDSNTATQLTFKVSLYAGVYTLTFVPGDTYEINRIVELMDAPGRVMGPDLAGVDTPTQQAVAAAQTLSPWYAWGNLRDGVSRVDFSPASQTVIENTHFYNNTVKPGYTPYTYPHPLVTAEPPSAPAPPASSSRVLNLNTLRVGSVRP